MTKTTHASDGDKPKEWTAPDLGIKADEFLKTLLGEARERPDETAMVAKRTEAWTDPEGRPVKAGYHGYQWPGSTLKADRSHINIGLFRTVPLGERQRALLPEWTGMWALVLDDVLEKVPAPDIDPTCIIETKPGSQQWWFVFEEVVRNRFLAEQLVDGAIRAGITDPGANNIVRWVRLPGRKPADKKFDARVVEWNPDLRFEPEALAAALGMELREWDHWNGEGSGFDIRTMGKAVDDPLLAWMDEAGMVTSRSGRDWVAIPCPRGDAHSNGDPDAYYLPARENGGRIFFCQHGHMHDGGKPTQDEFEEFLLDSGCPPELLRKARDLDELAGYLIKAVRMVKDAEAKAMSARERRRLRLEQEAAFEAQQEAVSEAVNAVPKSKAEIAKEKAVKKKQIEAEGDAKAALEAAKEDAEAAGIELDPEVPNVFEWVMLRAGPHFFHQQTGEVRREREFNLHMRRGALVPNRDGTAMVQVLPSNFYVDSGGPSYVDVTYRPDVPGRSVWLEGLEYFNSYDPDTHPEEEPGDEVREACEAHIKALFPEDWEIIIQWMARVVQRPGERVRWVMTLVGAEGDGKSVIGEMMTAAMGDRHTRVVQPETIKESFTEWTQGRSLAILEEISIPDAKRATTMNKLKPYITNSRVSCTRKGLPPLQFINITNYCAFTNDDDAVAPGLNDRRWGIFKSRMFGWGREEIDTTYGEGYFKRLYGLLRDHPGQARAWLMSVDTSAFNADVAPATKAKQDMVEATRSELWQQVDEALAIGGTGVFHDLLLLGQLREIITETLKYRRPSNSGLGKVLRQMGWHRLSATDGRMKIDGHPQVVYFRPGTGLTDDPAVLRAAYQWRADKQVRERQADNALLQGMTTPKPAE